MTIEESREQYLIDLRVLQRKHYMSIIDHYNVLTKEIEKNYAMGLIDFLEKIGQLSDIQKACVQEIKRNDLHLIDQA